MSKKQTAARLRRRPTGPKPKKSVALSGVPAGNTALCTVGRTGNDLHYRGYDILDVADVCEFEEIAHLLVHGKLPPRLNWLATRPSSKRFVEFLQPCAPCSSNCRHPRTR